jgi:hypothetical protein
MYGNHVRLLRTVFLSARRASKEPVQQRKATARCFTKMMWEKFGLRPEDEEQIYEYRQPYLELFDKGLVGLGHTIPGALMVGLACTELSGWCVLCVAT